MEDMDEPQRATMLGELALHLSGRDVGHPLRVGIDGVCGSGKSSIARELAKELAALGRPVIRVDSDGFHHERAVRYRNVNAARGYYENAYDLESLRDNVLIPLGPGGSRRFATRIHDLATDRVESEWADAPADAIVLFDCTFIQRGDLRDHWDEVIYLDVDLDRAQARGVSRDATQLGGADAATAAYESRYMAACRIYLDEEHPLSRASIVVDNDELGAASWRTQTA